MQVYENQGAQAGVAQTKGSFSKGVSKDFLKSLQTQMVGWVQAMADSKITQAEVNAINSGGDVKSLGLTEDTSESLFGDGSAAATLYATTQINDITNVMNFMISFMSVQKQLEDKVNSLFA